MDGKIEGKQRWGWWDTVIFVLALLPIVLAILFYDQLPDRMISHFGFNGQPNGYQNKLTFLVMYGVILMLPLAMRWIQRWDPQRSNYEKFARSYEMIRLSLAGLLSALGLVILALNLGYSVNIRMFVLLGIGVVFLINGNYLGQVRHNYMIGIRTPWTLANEEVWRRTHRASAPVWVAAGLLTILSALLPSVWSAWLFGIALGFAILVPVVYSYTLFKRSSR